MSAASAAHADSTKLLDAEQDELLALLADRELHAITRRGRDGIEQGRRRGDGHELHGAHAEGRDGLVANQEQVRRRTRHDRAADLVGRRPEDGAPEAGGEGHEQRREQQRGDGARNEGSRT
jgi:hypothetical protein